MKYLSVLFFVLLLTGCESASRSSYPFHRVEKWQVTTNAAGRVKRYLVFRETWSDASRFRFVGLFSDPIVAKLHDVHHNQTAIGGGYAVGVGNVSSTVDSAGINAAGGAVGSVIEKAIEAAKKFP